MLTEEQVLKARSIHNTLWEATRNPIYKAFLEAYDIVLSDQLPPAFESKDLEELLERAREFGRDRGR